MGGAVLFHALGCNFCGFTVCTVRDGAIVSAVPLCWSTVLSLCAVHVHKTLYMYIRGGFRFANFKTRTLNFRFIFTVMDSVLREIRKCNVLKQISEKISPRKCQCTCIWY